MKPFASVIPAVVLDWAGTTIDHGCLAPVAALQAVFAGHGMPVSAAEARVGMGLPKKEHLRALLAARGAAAATEALYPELERALFAALEAHSGLIAGTLDFVAGMRARGVRIGTTTGYPAAMMRTVAIAAARQGYVPDAIVTPDDVPAGRPAPQMIAANAARLHTPPLSSLVKIGDTPADVAEGRNAGAWTVGIALTGNALGLSVAEMGALPAAERPARFAAARESLRVAGADYVVDSIADCERVMREIYARECEGERPGRVKT